MFSSWCPINQRFWFVSSSFHTYVYVHGHIYYWHI
jgi:hypothetical protein